MRPKEPIGFIGKETAMLERYAPNSFERVSLAHIEKITANFGDKKGAMPIEADTDEAAPLELTPTSHFMPIVPPSTESVLMGCKFIQYCDLEREALGEPEWHILAGVLAHLPGGHEHFHKLSKGYPGYRKKETDAKFEHARTAINYPRTCESIGKLYSGCPTCPSFGKVHTPIEIGYSKPAKQIIDAVLAKVSSDPGAPFSTESISALYALKKFDPQESARARAGLKKAGVPFRELTRALKEFEGKFTRHANDDFSPEDIYTIKNGCISVKIRTKDNIPFEVQLCNFNASIVAEVTHDDGVDRKKYLKIEGTLANGRKLPAIQIPAQDFAGLNWVIAYWGTAPIIYAGQSRKDDLRAAIQVKSKSVEPVTVYTHIGWRELSELGWAFLHGRGAIHAKGNTEAILVSLGEDRIALFSFPNPPIAEKLHEAVRASIQMLKLGPLELVAPIFAAIYRAPLGPALPLDFSIFEFGRTGAFKSELAAIAQAHYGKEMDARNLPANWSSTPNFLERQAFLAKDALLVVDDFSPRGSTYEIQTLHSKTERVLRGAGNGSGRGRMNKELGLRASSPPRALILSSGEDVPKGHSLRARMLIIEVRKGAISSERLSELQQAAREEILALAMAAYLQWLASRMDNLKNSLPEIKSRIRSELEKNASHLRTADATANLIVGLETFFEFVSDMGVMSKTEADSLCKEARKAIVLAGKNQKGHQETEDEVSKCLCLLGAALVTGIAHVADYKSGGPPSTDSRRWGWDSHISRGQKIGWIKGDELWLDPEPTMAALRRVGQNENGISVTKETLGKRLSEAGFILAERQGESIRKTVKKVAEGMRQRCWVFPKKSSLYPYLEDMTGNGSVFEEETKHT